MDFTDRFYEIRGSKSTNLCVGIDPAYEGMRKENYVPARDNAVDDILSFSLGIIEKTGGSALAFKPNLQYVMPLGIKGLKELNKAIHEQNSLSILDLKLSDIGSTNDASCFWVKKCGFDAITGSPFPGNVKELWGSCKKQELGLFLLCLMSNPEAGTFMKSLVGNKYAYEIVSKMIEDEKITGAVVGATISSSDLDVLSAALKSALVLVPGIGTQKGSMSVIEAFGGRSLVNVSRDIIFSSNPAGRASYYQEKINRILF